MLRIYTVFFILLLVSGCRNSESVLTESRSKRPSPPREAQGEINGKSLKISYSAPSVRGRVIWGDLVPYGEIWRTGANEASILEIKKSMLVAGKELQAGKYALFTLPQKDSWTVILNSEWDQWGGYSYSQNKNVLTFNVSPSYNATFTEQLTFAIKKEGIQLNWEKLELFIPVQ